MTQASPDHPGQGDMHQVRTFASEMRTRANELEMMFDNVTEAANKVDRPETLRGITAGAWAARAGALRAAIGKIIDVLEQRRTAAYTYVDEVERIKADASVVWDERGSALNSLVYWQQSPLEYRNSQEGEERKWVIDGIIYRTEGRLKLLYEDRRAADTAFAQAVDNGANIRGRSASLLTGLGSQLSVGFTPRDIEVAEAIAATEELANNPDDEEALLRAHSELKDLGLDQKAWEQFYRRGGGLSGDTLTRTIDLIADNWVNYGRDESDVGFLEGVAVVDTLRDGLGRASTHWSTVTAERFTESLFKSVNTTGLFTPDNTDPINPQAIAILFNNPDEVLMGSALTLAVANQVDSTERSRGVHWPHAPGLAPIAILDAHLNDSFNREPSSTELAAQAFYSLAKHPDAALEFLTGAGEPVHEGADSARNFVGDARHDRVEYWFTRDWSYDGYEAPLTLLEGMQHATDGVVELDLSNGPLTDSQIATLTAQNEVLTTAFEQIAWGGTNGTGWSPNNVSNAADNIFLQTTENHGQLIAHSTVLGEVGTTVDSQTGLLTVSGIPGLEVPHLELDRHTLSQAYAVVNDVDAAKLSLTKFAGEFVYEVSDLMTQGLVDPVVALSETSAVAAFADGTHTGIAVKNGQAEDERASMIVDIASEGVSRAVGEVVSTLPGGGVVNDIAVQPSIEWLTGAATDMVATRTDVALEEGALTRAQELSNRADPQALMDYSRDNDHGWLGDNYRDNNGDLNGESFTKYVENRTNSSARHYGNAFTAWQEGVSDRSTAEKGFNARLEMREDN